MDQQQVRTIADSFITRLHHLEAGDPAGVNEIVDMFADDAELSNPIIERDGSNRRGRAGIEQFWREYGSVFGNIHSEFIDVTASDHSAGLFWKSQGTDPSGRPLEYEGVSLLMLDDNGKIKQFKGYFDSRQIQANAPRA